MIPNKLPFILAVSCLGFAELTFHPSLFAQTSIEVSTTVSEDYFYDYLQDDGDWFDSDDYGYIWQPRLARNDSDWRPYTDGRWAYTDRGWTWVSEEPFAWATYHYGRWVNLDETGWCWVPGDTWAPAWVSWRSNDRYLGWAPLPPEARISRGGSIRASVGLSFDVGPAFYSFISIEDLGEPTYRGRLVSREQNVTIINQTTNVTNIVYNDVQVNNYGPDYEVITQRSRRPVEKYRIEANRDVQRNATRNAQPRDGVLAVFVPDLDEDTKKADAKPPKVERKIAKTQRNEGWKDMAPEKVQQAKATLEERQKAAPPLKTPNKAVAVQPEKNAKEPIAAQPDEKTKAQVPTQSKPVSERPNAAKEKEKDRAQDRAPEKAPQSPEATDTAKTRDNDKSKTKEPKAEGVDRPSSDPTKPEDRPQNPKADRLPKADRPSAEVPQEKQDRRRDPSREIPTKPERIKAEMKPNRDVPEETSAPRERGNREVRPDRPAAPAGQSADRPAKPAEPNKPDKPEKSNKAKAKADPTQAEPTPPVN